jgi:DNA modification methylase
MEAIIKVDSEFKELIPLLTEEEQRQLEESIIKEGCRDALIVWNGLLLDGHHRLFICQQNKIPYRVKNIELANRKEAKVWIIRNQFARRNLTLFQRAELALKLEPFIAAEAKEKQRKAGGALHLKSNKAAVDTLKELGKIAGVGRDTIYKTKLVVEKGDEIEKERLRRGKGSLNKTVKQIKRKEKERELFEWSKENAKKINDDERWTVEVGDIKTYQTEKRFDFIITDPPYAEKYLPLYEVLARRAKEWLRLGGLLLVMCGHLFLPQIYGILSAELNYYWTGCYNMPGQSTIAWPLRSRIHQNWKPILIYSLKTLKKYEGKTFGDVWTSDTSDKTLHEWGQSESGMYSIIKNVCRPGQSIFDPFMGTGTTGVTALKHGCLFHGIDIEKENVEISRARLTRVKFGENIKKPAAVSK